MIVSILKITGMILLIILLIIIFILGIILFVPIRYRFSGSCYEEPEGAAYIRWTPLFFKVEAAFREKRFQYTVKLFGGVIMTNAGVPLSWIGRKFFSFEEEETQRAEENIKESILKTGPEEDAEKDISDNSYEKGNIDDKEYNINIQEEAYSFQDVPKEKKRKSVLKRIQKKIQEYRQRWKFLKKRLKAISQKKDALKKVYHSKRFEMAKQDVRLYLKEVLQILKPDQLEGYVHFGMEDPALTGQILGGLAMFLPFYQDFLDIRPDFEGKCLDGNLRGNGKIYLFAVVKLALKVIFNKNLIKVTKKVQTIIEA